MSWQLNTPDRAKIFMYHTKLMAIFGAICGVLIRGIGPMCTRIWPEYRAAIAGERSIIILILCSFLQSKVVRNGFPRKSPQNGPHPRRPRLAIIIQSTIFNVPSPLYNKLPILLGIPFRPPLKPRRRPSISSTVTSGTSRAMRPSPRETLQTTWKTTTRTRLSDNSTTWPNL